MPNDDYEGLSGPELDAAMRRRIEERMKARNGFYIHFIVFLGVNLLLWVVGLTTESLEVLWPLFVTIPWGMALVIHAYVVYQDSGGAIERRQEKIRREVELEKRRLGLSEKPKRASTMRLSDDGELVDDEESEVERGKISVDKHRG